MKLVIEKIQKNGKNLWIDFNDDYTIAYLHLTQETYNNIKKYHNIDKDYEEIIYNNYKEMVKES